VRSADEVTGKQAAETADDVVEAVPDPIAKRRWTRADTWTLLGFLGLAVFVVIQLWIDPNGRVLAGNRDDHGIFLFMLAHAERVVFDGAPLFYEDRLNVPVGVNMMANTSILALSLPLAPVTHFLGGGVTVALLITLGLSGTAFAWYWVFSRHLGRSPLASVIGAAWCGFAPAMVLALVPLIPKPLPIVEGVPMPEFLTAGLWRQYVPEGRTLVTVPLPDVTTGRTGQRWATLNNFDYATPRGYFMGPADPPWDDTGSWQAPHRYTSQLLWSVREYGYSPALTDTDRQRIREDLAYWRAAVVVLIPDDRNVAAQRATLVDALGSPELVGGVEIWRVNS
jgi:hypothetical protein